MCEEEFIIDVQNNSILWDNKNDEFKNSELKKSIWEDIGNKYNLSGQQAESLFTSLRQKYLREKKKHIAYEEKHGSKLTKKWHLMDSLCFLDEVITPRRTHTLLLKEMETTSKTPIPIEPIITLATTSKLLQNSIPSTVPVTVPVPVVSMPVPVSSATMDSSSSTNTSTADFPNYVDILISAMQQPVNVMNKTEEWHVKPRIKHFCKYLGERMNELPDDILDKLEVDIIRIVNSLDK